jgi:hypothetical protein
MKMQERKRCLYLLRLCVIEREGTVEREGERFSIATSLFVSFYPTALSLFLVLAFRNHLPLSAFSLKRRSRADGKRGVWG